MAKLDKKTRKPSCFLSCFRVSKLPEPTRSRSNGDKNKKSRRWLPLPRAWTQKSGAKTVPVDATTAVDEIADIKSEKAEARRRYDESGSKSKRKARRSKSSDKLTNSKGRVPEAAPAPVQAASDQDKPREIQNEVTAEHNPDPRSRSDHPEPDPRDKFQPQTGLSFCRKIEAIRSGIGASSQPGSPVLRTRPGPVSCSASFPDPPRKRPWQGNGGSLDPVVGMSIIMVILFIMVLWGKLCAILCTSAWLYFIPQMRSMGRSEGGTSSVPDPDHPVGLDLGSEEYKKKVVLEGLLERSRRSSLREKGIG